MLMAMLVIAGLAKHFEEYQGFCARNDFSPELMLRPRCIFVWASDVLR
jgi:hypothetical protein